MKSLTGLLLGFVGYTAWKLSEPEPGEGSDLRSRVDRLKEEWKRASTKGRVAGDARRVEMQQEFEAIFRK